MRTGGFKGVLLSALLIASLMSSLLISAEAAWGWWNGSWQYRKPMTINNTPNPNILVNYQTLVTVDTSSLILAGKMRSDCGDIRFTDESNNLIPYWVESGINSANTKIWVKVPSIPALGTATIYMYYGNPSATSESNGEATFDLFDDFSGDLSKWKTVNEWTVPPGRAGQWAIESGELSCEFWEGAGGAYIMAGDKSWRNYEYSVDIKGISQGVYGDFGVLVRWDGLPWIDPVYGLATENNAYRGTIRIGTYTWYPDSIGKIVNGVWVATLVYKTSPSRSLNTWYNVKMRVYENVIRLVVDDAEILNATDSTHTSGLIGNYISPFQHGHFDNARVRKYTEPEPTVAIGVEELVPDLTPPTITDITYTTLPPFTISARITDDVGLMYTGLDVLFDNQCFMCIPPTHTSDIYNATWYGDMYALTDGAVDVDPIYVSTDGSFIVNCLFDEDGDGPKGAVNASARFDPTTLRLTGIYSGWWSTVNPLTIISGTSKITPYNCYFKQIGRTSILAGEPPDYEFSSAGVMYVISSGSEYNLYLRKESAEPVKYHLNLWAYDTSGNQARYWYELMIPAPPVGGVAFPVDKLALLAPWIALAVLIVIATASIAVLYRRRLSTQGG